MSDRDWLAEQFEEHRAHLRRLPTGCWARSTTADDAVQEAWLRLSRTGRRRDREPRRLADHGRRARSPSTCCAPAPPAARSYVDSWMPDPVVTAATGGDPEQEALLADSVGLALLVVLETLTRGAARVRAARHVRPAVRRDRADRRPHPGSDPSARQPRPAAASAAPPPDTDADLPAARGRRCVPRRGARRRLRRAWIAVLDPDVVLRLDPGDRTAGGAARRRRRRGGRPPDRWRAARRSRRSRARRSSTARPGDHRPPRRAVRRRRLHDPNGRITEIDIVTDPAKLPRLELD